MCFLLICGCGTNQVPEKGYRISTYTRVSEKTEPEFTILYKNPRHENLRITAVCQPSFGNEDGSCYQLKRAVGTVIPEAKMFSAFSNADKRDLDYVEIPGDKPDLLVYNPNGLFDSKGHFIRCNKDCEFLGISRAELMK